MCLLKLLLRWFGSPLKLLLRWFGSPCDHEKKHDIADAPMDRISQLPWAYLPLPLLELILELLPVQDYIRFAGVCRFWRDVQRDHRRHHTASPRYKTQMPWLMLPQDRESSHKLLFYNPSEQKYYRLSLPERQQTLNYCGSSHGWLILLDANKKDLFLVNPFTGSKIQINIPEIVLSYKSYRPLGILSSVPADPDCRILLWDNANASLFSCRLSNKSWLSLRHIGGHFIEHVFCGDISGKVYGISLQNPILVMDDRGLPVSMSQWGFLMESDGKMFKAKITWTDEKRVKKCYVWEWDPSSKAWVILKSLGNRVFFLCGGHSFAMSNADAGGSGNRICLTWRMNSFDQENDHNHGQMWVEYDYGSHQVIRTKLLHSGEHGPKTLKDETLCWFTPCL